MFARFLNHFSTMFFIGFTIISFSSEAIAKTHHHTLKSGYYLTGKMHKAEVHHFHKSPQRFRRFIPQHAHLMKHK